MNDYVYYDEILISNLFILVLGQYCMLNCLRVWKIIYTRV